MLSFKDLNKEFFGKVVKFSKPNKCLRYVVFRKFGYQENVFVYILIIFVAVYSKNLLYPNGDFLFSFLSLCPHLPRL